MDWNAAIEKNREALKRVLAMLVAMAGLGGLSSPLAGEDGSARRGDLSAEAQRAKAEAEPLAEPGEGYFSGSRATLPRHLHRAVLSLLRPAEAAARRLIIVAARGIVVALPPARPRKPEPAQPILRNGIGTGIVMPRGFRSMAGLSRTAPRTLALPLFDRLPRWNARARGCERVSAHLDPRPDPAVSCPPRALVRRSDRRRASCPAARRARPRAGRLAARGKALRALAGCPPCCARARRRRRANRETQRRRPVSPRLASASRASARRPPVALQSGRPAAEEHPRRRRDPGACPRAGQLRAQPRHVMTPAAAFAERKERGRDQWPDCRDAGRGDDETRLSSPPRCGGEVASPELVEGRDGEGDL
jgi:hypothetical protein